RQAAPPKAAVSGPFGEIWAVSRRILSRRIVAEGLSNTDLRRDHGWTLVFDQKASSLIKLKLLYLATRDAASAPFRQAASRSPRILATCIPSRWLSRHPARLRRRHRISAPVAHRYQDFP